MPTGRAVRATMLLGLTTLIPVNSGQARVNPLSPFLVKTVEGGLAAGATCISYARNAAGGGDGGTLRLTGVAPGATVTDAFLYWSVLSFRLPAPIGTPSMEGVALDVVKVAEMDESPCFPATPHTTIFRADVSHLVSGDGTYVLAGFPTSGWPLTTEGATLFVVWELAGTPRTAVVLYDGIDLNHPFLPPVTQDLSFFTADTTDPVPALFVAAIGNGQASDEVFFFNGTDVDSLDPDTLDGTLCGGKYYDLTALDVSQLVPGGATSVTFELQHLADCHSVAAAALAVRGEIDCRGLEPSAGDLHPGAPPLRVTRAGPTTLRLTWQDIGERHQVWRGTIGGWYDHSPLACALDLPGADLSLEPGDLYYLVAGCGSSAEGGRDSFGGTLPTSLAASGIACP